MAKIKITTRTKFFYHHADSQPQWQVVKARGGDTWEAVVISDDWTGTRKVFGGEEIRNAINSQGFWEDMANSHEGWWNAQTIGATVHYHSGFGNFVRGVIVTEEGEKKMRATALVGNWKPYDLPRVDAAGNLIEGYHVRQIRDSATMQPNFSNMVEAVGVRDGETDPRGRLAIDLTPPTATAEQETAKRLNAYREQLLALMAVEHDPDRPFSDTLREALRIARNLLNDAIL